jgi:serine phosphatase RsbU (regulator of sigma subunit)
VSGLRDWLIGSFAGRALLAGALLKGVAVALDPISPRTGAARLIDTVSDAALVAAAAVLAYRLFVLAKRRLLWRVRRKLTLSYVFIGFVPALLIITFFVLCGLLLFFNVSAFMLRSRVAALVDQAQFLAQSAALEIQHADTPMQVADVLAQRQAGAVGRYPLVSYAVIPGAQMCSAAPSDAGTSRAPLVRAAAAGPWRHLATPQVVPNWVACPGFAGLVVYAGADGESFAARSLVWLDNAAGSGAVIVDIPLTPQLVHQLQDDTGIMLGAITSVEAMDAGEQEGERQVVRISPANISLGRTVEAAPTGTMQWVAFLQETDWATGTTTPITVAYRMTVGDIYTRISGPPLAELGRFNFGQVLLVLVGVVAGLFLVIQVVALGMGLALARSITGSVHDLFTGTERVRAGDFTHKIPITTRDQLGELAQSFNAMTASVEDLLQQKAVKERLEQELKVAREIQMSLLPQGPLHMPGLALTGHCEPAREVGGDYYDFVPLDDDRLGILIADVSGKGASAALYMAELKGVVFSLSQLYVSPRALLIDANRILMRHLDSRSFITMTYAVVDLRARTLTYARAGHCPLIYVPGPYALDRRVQILAPDGMVLGLQIDDGEMFTRLLEEVTVSLGPGDLFVLYTDGITEAMNPQEDCFGEQRLGQIVQDHAAMSCEELRERIIREVNGFVGPLPQQDDMTMLLFKVEDSAVAVS